MVTQRLHALTVEQATVGGILQRFPNWWVGNRFVVGREKVLKCDILNYIKIMRNGKVKKQNKIRKG
jgi:hypothetical protein